MKMQTTLEFIIVMAAVASLAVTAIAAYTHLADTQKQAFLRLTNQSYVENSTNITTQSPTFGSSVHATIANISYVNRSNTLEVVLSAPYGSVASRVYVTGTGAGFVPAAYYNVSIDGISVLQFSIVPKAIGSVALAITAELYLRSGNVTANAYAETYAIEPGSNTTLHENNMFSASLARRNESILYGIGGGSPTYTAAMWDRCSWMDWGYHQMPIQYQCGNANWYFFTFDSWCYWNHGDAYRTYCVELYPTNTTVSHIQDKQAYSYNTTLSLYNSTMRLSSTLSSSKNTSALSDATGAERGNASVVSVSGVGPQPFASYIILNASGAKRAVNASYYSAYSQYLNGMYAQMSYFNNSDGDPGAAQQAIDALNRGVRSLIGAPMAVNQYCSVASQANASSYSCKPLSGLYYMINASLGTALYHPNQSLEVQGSTINVR